MIDKKKMMVLVHVKVKSDGKTGWRHDGSEKGIKSAKEIGVWIQENNGIAILSNDGNWHSFDN